MRTDRRPSRAPQRGWLGLGDFVQPQVVSVIKQHLNGHEYLLLRTPRRLGPTAIDPSSHLSRLVWRADHLSLRVTRPPQFERVRRDHFGARGSKNAEQSPRLTEYP